MHLKGAYIIEEDPDGTYVLTYDDDIVCQTKDFDHLLDVLKDHKHSLFTETPKNPKSLFNI